LAIVRFFTAAQFQRLWPVIGGFAALQALTAVGWSAAHLTALAARDPAPSAEQLNGIVRFCTAEQAATLWPVVGSFANLLALAQAGWTAGNLVTQAGRDPAPTAEQLLAVARFFTAEQVGALWPVCANFTNLTALTRSAWNPAHIALLVGDADNLPTFAQLELVVTRFARAQAGAIVGAVGPDWPRLAGLATAAAPGVQPPAVTLRRALQACESYIDEQLAAINDALELGISKRRFTALLIGTDDLTGTPLMALGDYLRDARSFSVCFDTAHRLLTELGGAAGNESGGHQGTTYPLADQEARTQTLIGHLRAAALAPAPVIFEIHLGGHGFSLTVIGNQVYQLEAFASAVGGPDEDPRVRAQGLDLRMSLLNSIGLQRSYTLAAATTALAQMTADTRDQRQYGAAAMGWNAGPCGFVTAHGVKDPMAVWWKSASLLDNAQIAVAIARRVQRQVAAIRQILGVPDDGGE